MMSFGRNAQLSIEKLQLSAPPSYLTHDADGLFKQVHTLDWTVNGGLQVSTTEKQNWTQNENRKP